MFRTHEQLGVAGGAGVGVGVGAGVVVVVHLDCRFPRSCTFPGTSPWWVGAGKVSVIVMSAARENCNPFVKPENTGG